MKNIQVVENIHTGEVGVVVSQSKDEYCVIRLYIGEEEYGLHLSQWMKQDTRPHKFPDKFPNSYYPSINIQDHVYYWCDQIGELVVDGYKYRKIREALNLH